MKKLLSLIVLCLIPFQSFQTYAQSQTTIKSYKEKSIKSIEEISSSVNKYIKQLDVDIHNSKIRSQDLKNKQKLTKKQKRLERKQREIEKYLKETKKQIQKEKTNWSINKSLGKTKKIVAMKLLSAKADYKNIEESIPQKIAKK